MRKSRYDEKGMIVFSAPESETQASLQNLGKQKVVRDVFVKFLGIP